MLFTRTVTWADAGVDGQPLPYQALPLLLQSDPTQPPTLFDIPEQVRKMSACTNAVHAICAACSGCLLCDDMII